MSDEKLGRILDNDEPLMSRNEIDKALAESGFTGAGAPADQNVSLPARPGSLNSFDDGITNKWRHTSGFHQLGQRVPAIEFSNRERDEAIAKDGRHARAVRKPSIENGRGRVELEAQPARYVLNPHDQRR